jgi:hypothetical protein
MTESTELFQSVADPHHFVPDGIRIPLHFNTYPDPTFHFDADPDPTFHCDTDMLPDPDPVPRQSEENLRPLSVQALHGSIMSLYASIVSVYGPPLLYF